MKPSLIFGRDPALILAAVGVAVKLATALGWNASDGVQTAVNAIAAAAVGVTLAFLVRDGQVPAILGFVQAGLALLLGLGLHLSGTLQAAIMSAVAIALAIITRTQVSVPIPQLPAATEHPAMFFQNAAPPAAVIPAPAPPFTVAAPPTGQPEPPATGV
jgi:hypothetical protein